MTNIKENSSREVKLTKCMCGIEHKINEHSNNSLILKPTEKKKVCFSPLVRINPILRQHPTGLDRILTLYLTHSAPVVGGGSQGLVSHPRGIHRHSLPRPRLPHAASHLAENTR